MMPVSAQRSTDAEDLRRRLVRAVNRVCPAHLAHLREDIVQAALLRLIEIQKRDEDERVFMDVYLRKVAYSVMVDEIRRSKRRSELSLSAALPSGASKSDPVSPTPDPEETTQGRELGEAIKNCVSRVKTERSQALLLYLAGYTASEAAQILGWSKKRTENLIYRGMADLRRCLERKGFRP